MDLEDLYRILRTGHVQAQGIVDTVPDPMLVLDSALTVQSANRAFFRTFAVERYDTIGNTCTTWATVNGTLPSCVVSLER